MYTLDKMNMFIGNFTLISSILLSTNEVIAAFVAPVNIVQMMEPVR